MSKRVSTASATTNPFEFWPTPPAAVIPLVPELRRDAPEGKYVEPCAGDGALMDALAAHGFRCVDAFDIAPRREGIATRNAATLGVPSHLPFVTNPPWSRKALEPILANLVGKTTLWLLLPLDMAANLWTNPYMRYVNRIVPLGRVSWLGNGKAGMENSCWMRFSPQVRSFITERKPK